MLGYLLVRSLAWLQAVAADELPLRRGAAPDRALARPGARTRPSATSRWRCEVAECARLIKGYGETHRRGKANFLAIVDALVENPATASAAEQAAAIRKAREAALADPEGKALGAALGKPVVWLKPVART